MDRRRRRGFFIVFGYRQRATNHGGSAEAQCPKCRERCVLQGKVYRRWFTLFFVPVVPFGEGEVFTQCTRCGGQFHTTVEQFRRNGERGKAASFEGAIGLFNEMRETPGDGEKLKRLMGMYWELESPGEVISAGKAYAGAVEGSDGCMAEMARAYEALADRENALKWATAALAVNAGNGVAREVQGRVMG